MNRVPERDLLSVEDSDTPQNLGGTIVAVHVVQTATLSGVCGFVGSVCVGGHLHCAVSMVAVYPKREKKNI